MRKVVLISAISFSILLCWRQSSLEAFQRTTNSHPKHKLIEKTDLPNDSGVKRSSIKKEALPDAPQKKDDVIKAVEQYIKRNPDVLGGVTFDQIKLHYSSEIPATEEKPGIVFVQFVQVKEGLDVEGSDIHFTVKILKDRSSVVSVKTRVFADLALPSGGGKDKQVLKNIVKTKYDNPKDDVAGEGQSYVT